MRRDKSLDVAKGIAIILMMYGHLRYTYLNMDTTYSWIYSFHMPFFMYITGVLTNVKAGNKWAQIKNKAVKILLPYVIWNTVGFCVNCIFSLESQSIGSFLHGLLFGDDLRGNLPTWYLLAAFWISVLSIFVLPYFDTVKKLIVADVVAIVLVFFTAHFSQLQDYFRWKGTVMLLPFFITGYLLKKIGFRLPWWLIPLFLELGFRLGRHNAVLSWGYVTVGNGTVGRPYLYLASAFCTTIAMVELCRYLAKIQVVQTLGIFGVHSMIILCTHWIFGKVLAQYMEYGVQMFLWIFITECVIIGFCELGKRGEMKNGEAEGTVGR